MTSATADRPTANMAATNQPNRFSNYAMGNGRERNAQSIGSTFPTTNWGQSSSIWANSSSLRPRDTMGSRGSDEAFPNGLSGSSALAASSEADVWGARGGPWNNSDNPPTRNTSGSTSPNRTRDMPQNMHEYFQTSRQPIGQAGNVPNRTRPAPSQDPSSGTYKYPYGLDNMGEEKENNSLFGSLNLDIDQSLRPYRMDKRGSQEGSSYLNTVLPTRDSSAPPPGQLDTDQQQNVYGGNIASLYGTQQPGSAHSQRPPIQVSASFPSQTANQRAYNRNTHLDEDDLGDSFGRSLTLGESSGPASSGLGNAQTYSNPSQTFQFNPGSQPWDAGAGNDTRGFGLAHQQDAYGDSFPGAFLAGKRGSVADRASTSGSSCRPVNSPRNFGTPPVGGDPFGRPGSRDPRMASELERRGQWQHYLPQQPQADYNSYYSASYHPYVYDPYTQPNYRPTVPLTPYHPFNIPPYMGGAGVPMRPKEQDWAKGSRSERLEEFRSSSKANKRFELKMIYGHVVEFSGDQHGSRFIQQKLENANSDEKDTLFREIEPNAVQLMKDVFGNYVIQKFFEHGNQVQKKILGGQMKGKVVELSTQMYACRVVQKALEHVLVDQQAELVRELEPHVISIVKDQNGNHVVQKIIELVPRQYIGFIMDSFRGRVHELATHTYGCRVIQRMLEHGSEADKAEIMKEIHGCATQLIQDQYGNYVTQHVIQHGKPEDRSRMITLVTKQILALSKHKFASNVVEKCIEHGTAEDRRLIREKLTAFSSDGQKPLQLMMKDQYGNYVIQKLLQELEGPERDAFVDEMKPQFQSLKKVSTGRQVAAIERLMSVASSPGSAKAGSVNDSVAGTTPASPALHVDVSSAAPTPVLTMEPNTPQSSSPPSTNASATEESIDENTKSNISVTDAATSCPEVRVDEA